ncbi:MAG: class I SAM-dependent methyltransferase [Acidobacteriota bacterium]
MSLRTMARGLVKGVTWKNPVVNLAVHAVDPIDSIARRIGGRSHLPPYSIRARSVGIRNDIGGSEFVQVGQRMGDLLRTYAGLTPESNVLEIGCGCGRNAFALAGHLNDGNYTGMDIEQVALAGARGNRLLRAKGFQFDFLDVYNDAYNPNGRYLATEYVLPYPDQSFDIVFMVSVFTHMLTGEVRNYVRQIARVLKPGGRCFFTAFLRDGRDDRQFPFRAEEHSYANQAIPGIAVAYSLAFLAATFAASGMKLSAGPVWGTAHNDALQTRDQDIVVFSK